MPLILIVAIILIIEFFTHSTLLALLTPILQKIWSVIEWVILFLLRMNEPPGSRS